MSTTNKLFISYPHKPEQCVKHVILALKARLVASGFDVWLDERIKTGHDWRQEITKGLQESEWVLVFLNSHATRKDSICLDEIAMAARYKRGQIVSVLLEPEEAIKTPLVLGRIQFVKMEEWEKKYKENNGGNAWNVWLQKQADELIAAFERREDLLQRGELDLLHEVLQPDQYWDEIANRLDGFVGREWVIKEITQKLKVPDGPRMLWLNGGPGIGKTSIAARLAHDLELPAAGVYFCRFDRSQTHSAHNVIRTLAYQMACTVPAYRQMLVRQLHLGIDSNSEKIHSLKNEINKLTVYQLFKKLLVDPTYIGGEPHLLIIDGLDEITTDGGDNEIAKLLAGQEFKSMQKWLRVLITSRPDALLKEVLSHVEATTINAQSADNMADLREYLEQQTCLGEGDIRNKAIDTLLARSEGAFVYVSKAVDALSRGVLNPEQPDLFPTDLKELYRRYLERAYPNAKQFKEEARPLLELILASPSPLPVDVAISALGFDSYYVNEFVTAMGALLDYDLRVCEQQLSLFHRSFAEWLGQAAAPYGVDKNTGKLNLTKVLWNKFILEGVHGFDGFVAEAMPKLLYELSNTQRSDIIGKPCDSILVKLNQAVSDLTNLYKIDKATSMGHIHLQEIIFLKGHDCPETAKAMSQLAMLFKLSGKYSLSKEYYDQALAIRIKVFGNEHPDTVDSMEGLAFLLIDIADYNSAQTFFEQVISVQKNVVDNSKYNLARSLSGLATVRRHQGFIDEAIALIREAITNEEGRLENGCNDAYMFTSLAVLLNDKGETKDAINCLEKALKINISKYGSENPITAADLNNLASMYRKILNYDYAQSLLEQSIVIQKKTLGIEHADTAATLNNFATLYIDQKKYDAAQENLKLALTISEKILGSEHPSIASILNNLGSVLHSQKKYVDALPILKRSLRIKENIFGVKHPDTTACLGNLALLCLDMGDIDSYYEFTSRVLTIRENQYGKLHSHVANTMNNQAVQLVARGYYSDALSFFNKALEIKEALLGNEHPDTLAICKSISLCKSVMLNKNVKSSMSKSTVIHATKVGRNDPCPCGCGKKYKKCCGV